jgi:hypothetical protein
MSPARGSEEKKGRLAWGVQAVFEFDEGWLGLGGALVLCAFSYARAGTNQGAEKILWMENMQAEQRFLILA